MLDVTPVVYIVDDDISVRESLEGLIQEAGWRPRVFSSAQDFLAHPRTSGPNCLILDVSLPDLSGLDLQRHLAEHGIMMPIIFLTGHGDIAMSVQAMKAGAVDFLTKPVRDQTFLDAVSKAIETDIARRSAASETQRNLELYETLTPRERQVLRLVVKGLLNKQIAFELDISEVTVKLHRSSMMKKMNASSPAVLFGAWQSMPAEIRAGGG